MTWRSQTRHVTTIAYRLEDAEGNMPYDDTKYMTAYVDPATFANGMFAKYMKQDKYSIYEYIIEVDSDHITDDGVVKFQRWNAIDKQKVY